MKESGNPAPSRPSRGTREIPFAPYRLDLDAERLYRGNQSIPLRPKTFAVLRHLVEHPHVLVTKEALLQAVWAGVMVSESTLTKSIGEIRKALQDVARRPRFLETVHGRGFRFVAIAEMTPERGAPTFPAPPPHAVGRDGELARLHEALWAAADGARQLVFVTGEAGIGKTTLLTAFLAGLSARDARSVPWMATGQCVRQHGAHEPYMPVLEALARLARGPNKNRLVALLRKHAPSWLVQLPWLTTPQEVRELRGGLADTTRERMLRMFLQLMDELTAETPLVLALEDLHWADPSTLDLIAALGQRAERAALLVIGTYRPTESLGHGESLDGMRRTLASKGQCIHLPLDPLSLLGVETYLAARFATVATPELARLLHLHTDGHPLFLVTAVDHLVAHGSIDHTPQGLTVPGGLDGIEQSIPGSLRGLVEAQVLAADPFEIGILEAASVAGVEFAVQAVAAAAETEDTRVEEVCERLARSQRFLRRSPDVGAWPDGTIGARYAFVHSVYQRGLYDRLPPAQRQLLHRRIGLRLEAAYGIDASPASGEIAVHCERGHDPVRAIQHLTAAATDAERRYAPRETAAHVRRAVVLLEGQPMSPTRRRQELALRCTLVTASVLLGFPANDDGWTNYLRARELAADETDATQLFRLLYAMFISRIGSADAATAPMLVAELGRAAERLDVPAARYVVEFCQSYVAFYQGHHRDAVSLATIRHRDPAELDGFFYGSNPVILAGASESFRRWLIGCPDQALAVAEATVAIARAQPHPLSLCMTLVWAAQVRVRRGDLDEAEKMVDEGRQLAEEYTFTLWGALHIGTKGMIHARRNEPIPAAAAIGQALVELRASHSAIGLPMLLGELADTARMLGRIDDGLARVAEGLEETRSNLDPSMKVELWRAKGELLLAGGRALAEATECFGRAIEIARVDGALAFELRAATALARLLGSHGKRAEGIAVLAPVLAGFHEGLDTFDVAAARRVVQTLGR